MNPIEIDSVLESFNILRDTREQDTEQARRRYAAMGVPCNRAVLDYGDYAAQAILPDGRALYDTEGRIFPRVVIERKMNLDELAGCFTHDRKRFSAEMERARAHGAKVYLLVENATWENLMNGKYRSRFAATAFLASVVAWCARYGVVPVFCKAESSGRLITEILYRELKEALTGGVYG